MCPCVHLEVSPTDPPEHSATPSVSTSPAKAAQAITYHAHKKHRHGHKGRFPRGTTSKHSITSPSHARPGEKSCAHLAAPCPKKSKAERKIKHHHDQPESSSTSVTRASLELPSLLTPPGPSSLSRPELCMPQVHLADCLLSWLQQNCFCPLWAPRRRTHSLRSCSLHYW